MKKVFSLIMGLSVLLSSSFLVSAFVAIPNKNSQLQVKNQTNINYVFLTRRNLNRTKTKFFRQNNYREESFAFQFDILGSIWNYLNSTITESNPESPNAPSSYS